MISFNLRAYLFPLGHKCPNRVFKFFLVCILIFVLIYLLSASQNSHTTLDVDTRITIHDPHSSHLRPKLVGSINIVITICGNQSLIQGMNAIKSSLFFTQHQIHFVIMTDYELFMIIKQKFNVLSRQSKVAFTYELRRIQYPDKNRKAWRKLFKECASQRLFLPSILRKIDAILYVDTDVLFLSPVEELWALFAQMNSSQIAAMSYESEDFSSNWYHRFARHPYYGYYGVNSGVMLMNLSRMRQFGWNQRLEPIFEKYQSKIVWGDQDIINIIFSSDPDKLYTFPCNRNYRPDHCIYSLTCKDAAKEGIKILHGNRGSYLTGKHPEFKAMFDAFANANLSKYNQTMLVESFQHLLASIGGNSNCHQILSDTAHRLCNDSTS